MDQEINDFKIVAEVLPSITDRLSAVQAALKAPKGQFNNFGKYKYRNCEDILESVKPLLEKHQLGMRITDEIKVFADRVYVMATVAVGDAEKMVTTVAYAREPLEKKGMDPSQITGAASSYARKYALNGMFLIDDTKDADSDKPNTSDGGGNIIASSVPSSDLGSYVVKVGKYKGKQLKDIPDKDVISYANYFAENNKVPDGPMKEFFDNWKAYKQEK